MRTPGRKRPAGANLLMEQVSEEFEKKRAELGARKAAKELGVCLASFYKYIKRENLPDMEVLQAASEKWHIKWRHLDPSEVLRRRKVRTAEQLVFTFLREMVEDDIEIVEVAPDGESVLRVSLKIRIPV